jgi:hypothetical protein
MNAMTCSSDACMQGRLVVAVCVHVRHAPLTENAAVVKFVGEH